MQIALNVIFQTRAVRINPVFGWSSGRDVVISGKHSYRDFALPHPLIALPLMVHDHQASTLQHRIHDFYHCFRTSAVPKLHRHIFVDLSQQLLKHKGLKDIRIELLEMEFGFYRFDQENRSSDDANFWIQLIKQILFQGTHPPDGKCYCAYGCKRIPKLNMVSLEVIMKFVASKGLSHGISLDGLDEAIEVSADSFNYAHNYGLSTWFDLIRREFSKALKEDASGH